MLSPTSGAKQYRDPRVGQDQIRSHPAFGWSTHSQGRGDGGKVGLQATYLWFGGLSVATSPLLGFACPSVSTFLPALFRGSTSALYYRSFPVLWSSSALCRVQSCREGTVSGEWIRARVLGRWLRA